MTIWTVGYSIWITAVFGGQGAQLNDFDVPCAYIFGRVDPVRARELPTRLSASCRTRALSATNLATASADIEIRPWCTAHKEPATLPASSHLQLRCSGERHATPTDYAAQSTVQASGAFRRVATGRY